MYVSDPSRASIALSEYWVKIVLLIHSSSQQQHQQHAMSTHYTYLFLSGRQLQHAMVISDPEK